MSSADASLLRRIYDVLYSAYGPQGWWPGETPTEITIGAILVQNTNWQNVEKAIARLKTEGLLDWAALRDVDPDRLAEVIRPAGYYRVKARHLKNLVTWLWRHHGGDFDDLRRMPLSDLRRDLLSVNGIGAETADSILLYALELPTFVVDAYTARVVRRHGLIEADADYAQLQALFEVCLPAEVRLFNEFHALLVAVGKQHCRPCPQCHGCPLEAFQPVFSDE
jgi:endonuclease-3 related protein